MIEGFIITYAIQTMCRLVMKLKALDINDLIIILYQRYYGLNLLMIITLNIIFLIIQSKLFIYYGKAKNMGRWGTGSLNSKGKDREFFQN
jgi:hypothetical protein